MRFPVFRRRAERLLTGLPMSYNFATVVHLRGTLVKERLEEALQRLGRRHPLLASHVVITDEQAFFTDEGADPIRLKIVPRVSDQTWVEIVDQGLLIRPDFRTGPLLSCFWVKGEDFSDIVLVSDHSSADGRSAIIALRDLMNLWADPNHKLEPIFPVTMDSVLVPAIALRAAKMAASVPNQEVSPPSFSPVVSNQIRTITPFTLDKDETSTLIARCQAEGVTVQAALCAAFLRPFTECQPDLALRRAEIPVDLRPYLVQPTADWYGSFIALAVIEVDCGLERPLWEVARRAHLALKALPIEDLFFIPPAVYQVAERVPAFKPSNTEYDLSISNLGLCNLDRYYGGLEVLSVHAPIFNAVMPNHRILGVSTAGGKLGAVFVTTDPKSSILAHRGWELLRRMARTEE